MRSREVDGVPMAVASLPLPSSSATDQQAALTLRHTTSARPTHSTRSSNRASLTNAGASGKPNRAPNAAAAAVVSRLCTFFFFGLR